MNTRTHRNLGAALAFGLIAFPLGTNGQTPFDSGSDGSYGAIAVGGANGNKIIQLPPDGILRCTTLTVDYPCNLTFTKNAANTPVYILATGDVNITGYIGVSGSPGDGRRGGEGGPGGFGGGTGGNNPSNGSGPGGGKGGWFQNDGNVPAGSFIRGGGGFGTAGTRQPTGGNAYGNSLLIPLVGGSGGGGGNAPTVDSQYGGGGGGGALLIASNTKITLQQSNAGNISSSGAESSSYGGGSGGAIRLVAPTITGNAFLQVNGANEAGFGRIRIDALTNSLSLLGNSAGYATYGANMVVFPQNLPGLRVTKAAGQDIAPTQTDPVFVLLPAGAPATQTVQVQAKNFNSLVPLVAVVTPEAGDRTTYNFDIDNTAGGAATGSVQVQIPAGVSTRIDVWTR